MFGISSYFFCLIYSAKSWRLIYVRATQAIRGRYIRSAIGEFWSVISIALLILSTGLIWSFIWNVDAQRYLPYVACGHVIYLFVAGAIGESTTSIIAEKRLLYKVPVSPLIAIHILVLRNLITFAHHLPIIFLVIIWSPQTSLSFGLGFLNIFLIITFIYFLSSFLAILCVFYRDVIPLIASIMQVTFLMTPVIWEVDRIPEEYQKFVYINPFASAIEVLRNPILDISVSTWAIYSLVCWILLSFALSYFLWRIKSKNLIYWV